MGIKPIPKRLLPHVAKYKKYLGNTGEADEWDNVIDLTFVKFEEMSKLNFSKNGREVVANAKMFYDCTNSTGLSERPVENSKIIYGNITYEIVDVNVLVSDVSVPHHYELLLK